MRHARNGGDHQCDDVEDNCTKMRQRNMVSELKSACLDDIHAHGFSSGDLALLALETVRPVFDSVQCDDVEDDCAEEESPSFLPHYIGKVLQWWEGRKKPEHRVIPPDEFFVNKGEELFVVEIEHNEDQHLKALDGHEAFVKRNSTQSVERSFSVPMKMEEFFSKGYLHKSVKDALQSFVYHSVQFNVKDPKTKKPIYTVETYYEWAQLKILRKKEDKIDEHLLEIEEDSSPQRSKLHVKDIPSWIMDSLVQMFRHDDDHNDPVEFAFCYGSSEYLICSKDAASDFLEENYVDEYDVLLNPRAMLDCMYAANKKKYVHDFLLISESGKNSYGTARRKFPQGLQGLMAQVMTGSQLICEILFLVVAINGTAEFQRRTRRLPLGATFVPFCVPMHPQHKGGYVGYIVVNDGHLRRAIFSNCHGALIGNHLICCAEAKFYNLDKDLSILVSFEKVVDMRLRGT